MSVKRNVPLLLFIVSAFLAGIFFTTLGSALITGKETTAVSHARGFLTGNGTTALNNANATSAAALEDAFTQVAQSVNPAVVQIRSEKKVAQGASPLEGTPFEDMMPNRPNSNNNGSDFFLSEGLGSGVIASETGYIITNNHVISNSDQLEVRLHDGRFYDASIVGTDPLSDLAVIKIEAENLPYISYGQIDEVQVGQWVMAFGSPLSQDLGNTATLGIVSATERTSDQISSLNVFSSFIQTDATIYPGNSGGPLVDINGRLIGINSAIFTKSGNFQGIGFAIPVDVVENVATQLVEQGIVKRGFLGVNFAPVSETLSEVLDVPRGAAQITAVTHGSAADQADLRQGDIILQVDRRPLLEYNQLRTIIANKRPAEQVDMRIVRNGEEFDKVVILGERDNAIDGRDELPPRVNERRGDTNRELLESLGLSRIETLNEEFLEELDLEDVDIRGVIIIEISPNGTAYRDAKLQRGDVIIEVADEAIVDRDDFMRAFDSLNSGETALVRVLRPQGGQFVSFLTALEKP